MKKYYGVLIALVPFISGAYKNLNNWSDAELVGYNIFNLLLIGFGIYYFRKHRTVPQLVDLEQYDIAISKATIYLYSLKESDLENDVVKRVVFNELKNSLDLCHKNRNKKWKSQKEVDEIASDLNSIVEGNKELIEIGQNIEL